MALAFTHYPSVPRTTTHLVVFRGCIRLAQCSHLPPEELARAMAGEAGSNHNDILDSHAIRDMGAAHHVHASR